MPSSTSSEARSDSDEQSQNSDGDFMTTRQDSGSDSREDEVRANSEASAAVRAQHALNQRRLHAEILGVRIRMQRLVHNLAGLGERPAPLLACRDFAELLSNLLRVRQELLARGSFATVAQAQDLSWEAVHDVDEELWGRHREVVDKWERRVHLTMDKGKQLRALSRGAFDQVDAVLARRKDLGAPAAFAAEDEAFYDALLRDFISSMDSPDAQAQAQALARRKKKRSKRPNVDVKATKGRRVRFEVHEKLVDFRPPSKVAPPAVDVERLVKRLFV
jgi:hypothetical protein